MSMKSKLGIAAVLAVLLVAPAQIAFAAEPGSASGNAVAEERAILVRMGGNTTDERYIFELKYSGATWATHGRKKLDATSTYIQVKQKDMNSCKVFVDGGHSPDGPWSNQVSYWSGTSVGNSATVDRTGQFHIMNRVYENGYGFARLSAWAYDGTGTLYGYWSPDSWGMYEKIND